MLLTLEDNILFLQIKISKGLMDRWKINEKDFVAIDNNYGILEYIRLCYEPFHLTGDEGIYEEIEDWIKEQGGKVN